MSTNTERTRASAFGLVKDGEREQSGAFPITERDGHDPLLQSDALIAELSPELVSLIPEPPAHVRRPTPSERAELVIEDLSLWPENPYLASSLVPPPKRPFPMARALTIACGMLAAAAIGAVIQLNVLRAPHQPAQKQQTSAGITAPAPVAVASPRELIAPPAPVVAAPAPVAPVATAAPVVAPKPPAATESASVASAPAVALAPKAAATPRTAFVAPPTSSEPKIAAPLDTATRIAPVEAVEPVAVAPAADLPEYPTREQVTAGFESVRSALAQCAGGQAGTAQIKATIGNTGRISYALVGGDFDGTPAGSCMAKAVREAQFPAFAQPRLKVTYPFAL